MPLNTDTIKSLSQPLPKEHIQVKPGSVDSSGEQALVLTYMDARAVQCRLDEVCPGEWSFDWVEVAQFGSKLAVKGMLTVCGITRSDVGQADAEDEPYKSAVSDALKRCAVHFGIGRYLYDLPKVKWPGKRGANNKGFYFDKPWELVTYMQSVCEAVAAGKPYPSSPARDNSQPAQSAGHKPEAGTAKVNAQHIDTLKNIWSDKFGGEIDAWKAFLKETIGHSCKFEYITTSEFTMLCSAANKIKKAA